MLFINKMPVCVISADMEVVYLEQSHHPAEMTLGVRLSRMSKSSLHFDSAIFLEGASQSVSIKRITLVWFDFEQNRSNLIPQDIRQTLVGYEALESLQS